MMLSPGALLCVSTCLMLAMGCEESKSDIPRARSESGSQTESLPSGEHGDLEDVNSTGQTDSASLQPGALRLTPEQISNLLTDAFGVQMVHTDEAGYVYDEIVDEYGVSLGGIDFVVAARRDPSVKASTLLVVHAISWSVSESILWADLDRAPADRKLFTLCNPEEDYPLVDVDFAEDERADLEASDARWRLQLDEIYWRVFSRAPSEEEVQVLSALFSDAAREVDWPGRGWQVLIYTLISTVEFWTI